MRHAALGPLFVLSAAVFGAGAAIATGCGGTTGQPPSLGDNNPDATATPDDAGVDLDVYTGQFDVVIPYSDAALPEAAAPVEAGPLGTVLCNGQPCQLPCTTAGQTNCVACDQTGTNDAGLCNGTEALIVQRDIEKGYVSGGKLTAASCYECLVSRTCIDSKTTTGADCEDITAASGRPASATDPVTTGQPLTIGQACLDALNCILGNPQAGTAGAGGTPAKLLASCSNDPGVGPANCFCGPAETDVTDCEAADRISAGTTGEGLGSDSPNGVCASSLLTDLGVPPSTSNTTVVGKLGSACTGPGQAFLSLNCGGANTEVSDDAGVDAAITGCPSCWQ